jgi:tyrosine phenol-lyase
MERETISADCDREGKEVYADLGLTRIALPKRVYSLSYIEYIIERPRWACKNRELIKGLKSVSEPPVLRFFLGKLSALDNWSRKFCVAFKSDFGENR